jgi:hypothetical protein
MLENWAIWVSEHGQITKIGLSDGCGGETIPTVVKFGYGRNGFGGYLLVWTAPDGIKRATMRSL